ncbi:MAG: hypothetical protein JSU63_14355 [Phycisphaerales bacterium]|nr:MAG: hypothetical protein JSU63_14355 [Phycisphaerales bacterium]
MFFHFSPENLEVLQCLLHARSRNVVGVFFRGFAEHVRFCKSAHGWALGTAEACFVYMFTWPFYLLAYGKRTLSIERRVDRMQTERIQVSSPPQANPIPKLGFWAALPPWGFSNLMKRGWQFAEEANRICQRQVERPIAFLPFGGYRAAKTLLQHFEAETATFVADPDNGIYDTYVKYDRYPGRDFDWHVWEEQLAERAEFYRGHPFAWSLFRNPRRKLNDLIDALDRHVEYHRRVAEPVKAFPRPD